MARSRKEDVKSKGEVFYGVGAQRPQPRSDH